MRQTLVMIPGLMADRRLFAPQIELLSPDWDIVVADHTQDSSMEGIASRLLNEALDTFALLGLSMGGYAALEVMRQAPQRVSRLALLDTSARPDTEASSKDRLRLIALAEAGRFQEVPPIAWQKLVSKANLDNQDLRREMLSMLGDTDPQAFIRQQRAIMSRVDSRDFLPSIEVPTLVLVGEDDVLTPPELAREMADRIEWSSLVVVPGAGHSSTLEQPERVGEALRLWLRAG